MRRPPRWNPPPTDAPLVLSLPALTIKRLSYHPEKNFVACAVLGQVLGGKVRRSKT